MTPKQRAKKAGKALDLYEQALNLYMEILRDTGVTDTTPDELVEAHEFFRMMRLEWEDAAEIPSQPAREPTLMVGLADYDAELGALFSGNSDEDLERQYEQAVEIRDWFTCDLICDEWDRRARQPVGY